MCVCDCAWASYDPSHAHLAVREVSEGGSGSGAIPKHCPIPPHSSLFSPSDTNKRIRAHSFRQSLHSRQCGEELSKIALDSGADLSFKSASTMAVGRLISLGYDKEREGEKESEKSKMRFDYHPHNLHLRHAPSLNLLVYDKIVETLSQDSLIVQDYLETLKETNNCYITGLCCCCFCIYKFYFFSHFAFICKHKILVLR